MRHELKRSGEANEGEGRERRLHGRLAYVVRIDNRASVERSARRGHAGRVKSGRVVYRCIRSAYRSRR
jgi:hypothetical protein